MKDVVIQKFAKRKKKVIFKNTYFYLKKIVFTKAKKFYLKFWMDNRSSS